MREVVVVSAVRTAIGKGVKGSLKDTRPTRCSPPCSPRP
jgi:acetyl-CoA acetyltransferase